VDVGDVEVEDAGVAVVEVEVEVEDVDGDMGDDDISTWSSVSAPSSPAFGILTDDGSLPPTSDAGRDSEFAEVPDDVIGQGWSTLKRKHRDEPSAGLGPRWKVARREEAGVVWDGSGAETDDDDKQSRSAMASKRLRESMKSGDLVVDERKRRRFEEKCVEMDPGAGFRYQHAGWQVLHSKCLRWYKMSEPYNATKFKLHLGTCKAKGNERNASITSFFKPRDPNDVNAEAKTKTTISGRKHIFIGSAPSSIKPPHNKLFAQTQPCCGISDIHNPLVSTYISRSVVEGAGSISLQKAMKKVYGDDVKYSELTTEQKATVAATQSHLRLWSINRELQVIFSTDCMKFVQRDQHPKTICKNCEKVAGLNTFKRSLRVKPVPLERMKYIPVKYRGPLEDLGAKFASIQGLSELLQEVSSTVYNPFNAIIETNAQQDQKTSMWVRFVRGVIKGEYDDKLVFLAMIQATVTAHDRESRGVGLQNMTYLPIYEEFTQMVALTSPRTYRLFAPHIQLPSLRHHR